MRNNIFAYTAPGSNYPEFVSVNQEESGDLSFTVRSNVREDGRCGDTATAVLSPEDFQKLVSELFVYVTTHTLRAA